MTSAIPTCANCRKWLLPRSWTKSLANDWFLSLYVSDTANQTYCVPCAWSETTFLGCSLCGGNESAKYMSQIVMVHRSCQDTSATQRVAQLCELCREQLERNERPSSDLFQCGVPCSRFALMCGRCEKPVATASRCRSVDTFAKPQIIPPSALADVANGIKRNQIVSYWKLVNTADIQWHVCTEHTSQSGSGEWLIRCRSRCSNDGCRRGAWRSCEGRCWDHWMSQLLTQRASKDVTRLILNYVDPDIGAHLERIVRSAHTSKRTRRTEGMSKQGSDKVVVS